MSDEKRADEKKRMGLGEGIKSGIGILAALKDAVEETIQEAVDRGDLSPERAKDAVQGAMRRAQDALQDTFGDVRERLDVIPRREFDELRAAVAELSRRVDALEGRLPVQPDHLLPPT
jgi:polyhydroxyalkanoate synthesis regulator phasin